MSSQEINEQLSSSVDNVIEDGNELLTIVPAHEDSDALMTLTGDLRQALGSNNRGQPSIVLNVGSLNVVRHHQQIGQLMVQQDNRRHLAVTSNQPARSDVPSINEEGSTEAHETNYPRSSIRSSSSSRQVQQQTTPTETDQEVLQDTISKALESASLSSSSPSHVYPSTQSSSSNPEATPQLTSQTPSSSQRTTSSLHSEQQKSSKTAFKKLQKRTRKLYHTKHDVDVSNVDVSPENIPEIYPEMLQVDFYQGRFIPDDDNYNPKSQGIQLTTSDRAVTINQLVSEIQKNRFVSVIGYPGSGKTTLSKRLARRLSQRDDCLVLRMLFMEMNNCNDHLVLKEFLLGDCNYRLKDEEKNSVFECITDIPENCFIILDGFDQVSWTLENDVKKSNYNTPLQYWELVSNLCLGKFLENCHLIFTSRPHAMVNIPKRCRPKRTYFIRDLTSDNMKTLFDALVNNQQKSKILWNNFTVKTPHLKSMSHNPLMLQLYVRASLGSSQIDDISTMTRIFYTVLLNLKTSTHAVSTSDDIVIRLSKIAYEATQKGTVLITTDDLMKERLTSQNVQDLVVTLLGANREYALLEGQQRLYFTHQTFQEYFSALYICREMSLPDFTSFVQNNLLKDHWAVVVQFTAGLLLDPIMNKDLSSSAINKIPSVESTSALTQTSSQPTTSFSQIVSNESTSALTQSSTSSSQIASNTLGPAINQQPSIKSALTQKPSQQTLLSQPPQNLSQDCFHQTSQQPNSPSTASNQPQSSSKDVSSVFQKPKPQRLMSRLKYFTQKIFPGSSSSSTIQFPSEESVALTRQQSSQQTRLSSPGEKLQKQKAFISELYKKTREVAANHKDRRSIAITKILREGNDLEVIVTAGSHFDGGRIRMKSSDTQNDIHAVTSFLKSMPMRIGILNLSTCKINSHQFRPLKEAIKSMPGSIVRLNLYGNFLSVDDAIEVLHKVDGEVWMVGSLDDRDRQRWRDPNIEERSKLQEALDQSDNKKLKINIDGLDYITHKDQ